MKTKIKKVHIKPSKKKGENKVNIVLGDELTIYTIEEIKDDIINAIKKYDEIEINGANTKNIDLTFIQLIKSIQKTSEEQGKVLTLNIDLNEESKTLFDNTDVMRIIKK